MRLFFRFFCHSHKIMRQKIELKFIFLFFVSKPYIRAYFYQMKEIVLVWIYLLVSTVVFAQQAEPRHPSDEKKDSVANKISPINSQENKKIKRLLHELKNLQATDPVRLVKNSVQLVDLSQKNQHKEGLVMGNYYLGWYYYYLEANCSRSLAFLDEASRHLPHIQPELSIKISNQISHIYLENYRYLKAYKLLQITRGQLNDKRIKASLSGTLIEFADFCSDVMSDSLSIIYLDSAVTALQNSLLEEAKNPSEEFRMYLHIISACGRNQEFTMAEPYIKQVLSVENKIKEAFLLNELMIVLGDFYYARQAVFKAKEYYEKAYLLGQKHRLKHFLIRSGNQLAKFEEQEGDFETSEKYTLAVSEELATSDFSVEAAKNYAHLANLKNKQNDLQKALEYSGKSSLLSDLITDLRNNEKKQAIQFIFLEKTNLLVKNAFLEKNIDIVNFYRSRHKTMVIILLAVLALFLGVLFALYRVIKQRKKVNEELEEKVKERTLNIENSAKKLAKINNELDTFLYRSSHDLKGPVATLEGLINITKAETDKKLIDKYLDLQRNIIAKMKLLLLRIIEIGHIRSHKLRFSPLNLKRYIERIVKSMRRIDGYKETQFILNLKEYYFIKTDLEMLDIAVDNVIRNAIQHSKSHFKERQVKIWVEEDATYWNLFVSDNGLGIAEESRDKIFNVFYKSTDRSPGFGLGLYKARLAMNKMDGDVYLDKSDKDETTFCISIAKTLPIENQIIQTESSNA